MDKKQGYIVVNFGGPRDLSEIESFLRALLTDQDVIRTAFPPYIHRLLFSQIAKKRAKKVEGDYASIGGKSPIFEDTEAIASQLRVKLKAPILTFHRYLPQTHPQFLQDLHLLAHCHAIRILPLFPQFSYTTTGSIARWFDQYICRKLLRKMRWIKSYPEHPQFVTPFQLRIKECLSNHDLNEAETLLLFSAHGLPKRYVRTGDPYQEECERSFQQIAAAFPQAGHQLCYQSLFGKEEWLRPYASDFCKEIDASTSCYRHVVMVPLSFTSDHIETLFEIEQQYLPVLRDKGFNAIRCPALNCREDWIDGLAAIAKGIDLVSNQMLIRKA